MPKKAMEILTETMFHVLMASNQSPMCGIEIVEYIEQITNRRVQLGPATLYTILGKFEREKWIKEVEVEGRKRTYRITDKGLNAYEQELRRLEQCVQDAEKARMGM